MLAIRTLPCLVAFAPSPAAVADPAVAIAVSPTETVIDSVIPGGLSLLDSAVVRIDGSSNLLYDLLLLGPPVVTVEVDPMDDEHVTMTLAADLTGRDLSARIALPDGRTAADWFLSDAPGGNGVPSPLGMHVVNEDFHTIPACDGQPATTPDFATFEAAIDALRPGWVRVNGPKPLDATWNATLDLFVERGTKVLATLYVGTAEGAPWPSSGGPESKGLAFERAIEAYADEVDAWQLENELTISSKWADNPHIGQFDHAAQGLAYADLFAVLDSVVEQYDPTALRVPFGVQSGGESKFTSHFMVPLDTAVPMSQWVIDLHAHKTYDDDFEQVAVFAGFATGLEAVLPAGTDVVTVSTECSTWSGDPDGLQHWPQTEAQQARCAVNRQLALRAHGSLFTTFGPVFDRPCWQGEPDPHKFTLNGHYHTQASGSAPKEAAFGAERVAILARTSGWSELTFGPNDAPGGLRELFVDRAGGVEAGRVVVLEDVAGSQTVPYVVDHPAGVVGAVVMDLVPGAAAGLDDPGILAEDGRSVDVGADALWIEWLRE